MAYTPYYSGGWQSGEEGNTPITPAALNNIEDGISALNTKSLGSFATLAALGDALTTELQSLGADEHKGILFSMSSAASPFAAVTYLGTLYKGGSSTNYANIEVIVFGGSTQIVGYYSLSNGWTFTNKFSSKQDAIPRLDIPGNGSATFSMGTTASPYGTCLVFTTGYSSDKQGMYILTRSASTLIKSAVKDATGLNVTMDSSGVVTIANTGTSIVYAVVYPIAGTFFN